MVVVKLDAWVPSVTEMAMPVRGEVVLKSERVIEPENVGVTVFALLPWGDERTKL